MLIGNLVQHLIHIYKSVDEITDTDSIFIGVYTLYLRDPMKIRKEMRSPLKYFKKAMDFAFPESAEQNRLYGLMKDEYLRKLDQFRTADRLAVEGRDEDDSPKKK